MGVQPQPSGLLERERELDTIERMLAAAGEGAGAVLWIEGPAGIGKTELVRAAAARAQAAGMLVLSARAGELEHDFPFGVVRQLFEPAIVGAAADRRESLFCGAAALARPIIDEHPSGEQPVASHAALHGLYWLCANIAASQPLVLTIDDAHWADRPSLRWLEHLSRRIERMPMLLAVTVRPAEEAADPGLLEAISRSALPLAPGPLGSEAVLALATAALGYEPSCELSEACREATGGNPFLLHELLRQLAGEAESGVALTPKRLSALAPRTVARAVLLRMRRLDADALPVARALAVVGDGAELADVAALAGVELDRVSRLADALALAEVVGPGRPLSFIHPIVRTAVYMDMASGERAVAHRRAAELLADRRAAADRVAAHLLATEPGGDAWTVERLRAAGRDAVARGAPDSAVPYLRRAIAEPPPSAVRAEVRLELALALAAAGSPEAERHLVAALEECSEPAMRAMAARALIPMLLWQERTREAVAIMEPVLDDLAQSEPELGLRLEADLLATTRVEASTRASCVRRLRGRKAPSPPRSLGDRMLLGNLAVEGCMRGHPAARVADMAELALGDGDLLAGAGPDSPLYGSVVRVLSMSERYPTATRHIEAGVAAAQERGSMLGFAVLAMFRGELLYRIGDVSGAAADTRASADIALEHGWIVGTQGATGFLIDALIERGALAEADAAADAMRLDSTRLVTYGAVMAARALARLRIAEGRLEEGVDIGLAGGRAEVAWLADNPAVVPWRSNVAPALRALGRRDEARELADEELRRVRRFGSPRAIGVALIGSGLSTDAEEGIALLREAVGVLERASAPLEHARALIELGAALRRAGERAEAREHLLAGAQLARDCGALALFERARDEDIRAGARPRRWAATGVEALTPSELRVARMAGTGMSNREIAQALFVTIKTVEVHLSQAYHKLSIESRAQLAGALDSSTSNVGG